MVGDHGAVFPKRGMRVVREKGVSHEQDSNHQPGGIHATLALDRSRGRPGTPRSGVVPEAPQYALTFAICGCGLIRRNGLCLLSVKATQSRQGRTLGVAIPVHPQTIARKTHTIMRGSSVMRM